MEDSSNIKKGVEKMSEELEQRIREEEKKKYVELNNLREEDCTDQDLENINFNIKYRLEKE